MGLFGTTKGSFFEAPDWVDKEKQPGNTNQAVVYGKWGPVLRNYITTMFFFYSPNLTWFSIAAVVYFFCPYDFEAAAKGYDFGWVAYRACVNTFVVFAYFGFWNLSLYSWGWGTRKFNSTKNPTASRQLHNMGYTLLGCLQWTVWEVCFVRAYATNRLPYVKDEKWMSGEKFEYTELLKTCAWILFVPLWRDFHFYFAHRFLHIRVLYKHVHSLHHRNTDIEPFSGLCMHPIEHLFYYSCVGPSLYIHASPFIMMWNGIHLLISPAASHSGWEDHFQSDQFHYLHHAKFECNYGTSGPPLDKMFGTFREKLGRSLEFKAVSDAESDIRDIVKKPNEFLSGKLKISDAIPDRLDTTVYNGMAYACLALFVHEALHEAESNVPKWHVAAALAFGPIIVGFLTLMAFGDNKSLRWPFHKESFFGGFGFHLVVAFIMVVIPVYHFGLTVLGDDTDAPMFAKVPYFAFRGLNSTVV
jgi:sterol desaturase/sphingolipid hydroxylase (fatty acid hydroxylase superfamily)